MTPGRRAVNRITIADHPRFAVYADEIRDAGGTWRHLVVAPRGGGADLTTGVAILPVDSRRRIGLLRVYRHALGEDSWEIPRGFVDHDDPLDAAIRELDEETGLRSAEGEMKTIGTVAPDAGVFAARIRLFVAGGCEPCRPFVPAEYGHREFRWWTAGEFQSAALAGTIQDSYTLAAFALWQMAARPA